MTLKPVTARPSARPTPSGALALALAWPLALALAACSSDGQQPAPSEPDLKGENTMAPLVVESDAFKNGQPLPRRHTGDGEDLSPALRWSGAPAGTREFALTCDDPDAPGADPWAHWVVYKLPATLAALPEGVARDQSLPALGGALQGRNSWPSNNIGYRGPQPPAGSGAHHYRFRVYALSAPLDLPAGATRAALAKAMKGKVLAEGEVVGTYERRGTKG